LRISGDGGRNLTKRRETNMEGTQKGWNDIMAQWMGLQQTFWKEWMTFA
jgi:hypothetical protein